MDKFYEEPENYTQEMPEDSYNEQEEQYIGKSLPIIPYQKGYKLFLIRKK